MSSTVPSVTLSNGTSAPTIGEHRHCILALYLMEETSGLGTWAGITAEERHAATAWILGALQVRTSAA